MSSVLKTRALTGIIFSAIVISLLVHSKISATILLILIAVLSSYEYGRLVYSTSKIKNLLTVIFSAIAPIALIHAVPFGSSTYYILLIVSLICAVWNMINLYTTKNIIPHRRLGILVSAVYIGMPVALFISLINSNEDYNYLLPLGIVLLIWTSDSMAYLVGSMIGKTKLFPSVSPNKTWEGTLGAGAFTVLAAYAICNLRSDFTLTFWIICGIVVWIFGGYGDLVESQLKRYYKVKDSGKILPGHGGFLDRFDSFIFVLPFVILLYLLMQ